MNMAGFGQGIKLIGLHHMQDLANQEEARLRFNREMADAESKAKGEAVGSLAGTGVGLLHGAYDIYQKNKPMDNPPGGVQAAERAAKEAVAPEKVLGKNTPLARKDTRTLSQKIDDQYPSGLGGAAIREGLYRPEVLDEDTSWVDGFKAIAGAYPSHILDRGGN